MSDIRAKNIGQVINNPQAPVHITNNFAGGELPFSLPSNIASRKGFVGRRGELDALRAAKQRNISSFVLHGQGGVGKTELALQFIDEVKPEFAAHIRVDMQGLSDSPVSPKGAMLEIVRAFDPSVQTDLSEQEVERLYSQFLNQHKTLILLDNAKDRQQVEPLNHASALVVITSRQSFTVSGGFVQEIEQMSLADATALLFSVVDEKRFQGQAEALARLAGYLPIALLPMASILAEDITLEAVDLVEKYSDRTQRLQLADPNRGNRSVEASFDLSYERLSDDLKERWRLLSVFPADFTLEATEAIWQQQDAKEILSELVKRHLVIFDPKTRRAHLHDLARDYTQEKLQEVELRQAQISHARYYAELVSELRKVTIENLAIFDLERKNIEAGFAFAQGTLEVTPEFAWIIAGYTGYAADLLFLRLSDQEIYEWQEVGFRAYEAMGNLIGQAYSLNNLGRVLALRKEYDAAAEYYKKAIEIVHDNNEPLLEANWLGNLANLYNRTQQYDEAIEYYEKAINASRQVGNREAESRHWGNVATAYFAADDYEMAIKYSEEALSFEELDIEARGYVLGNLALLFWLTKKKAKAKKAMQESLTILQALRSAHEQHFRKVFAEAGLKV